MHVITSLPAAAPRQGRVITVGTFDGVHLGHQAVIAEARRYADTTGAELAALTFTRHPAFVVRPESAPLALTTLEQKLELLDQAGVDTTVVIDFDERFAVQTPDEFVDEILVGKLGAQTVVVGRDFHFGVHRSGTVDTLRVIGKSDGVAVVGVELLMRVDGVGESVSSTAIRRALAGGDVSTASKMLGRPFEVRGVVEMGDQRGRTIGFPTANIPVPKSVSFPADAVYAGWYERPSGEVVPTAISLGRRPTFYEHADQSLLEAHLINFSGNLYGEVGKVRFVALLRGQRRFDGIDALKQQLEIDVAAAEALLRQS